MTIYKINASSRFQRWHKNLKHQQKRLVNIRLMEVEVGDFGDHHQTDKDLWEFRFMSGDAAGIRIYYTIQNNEVIFLAAGGNKSSQKKDIEAAKKILQELKRGL